MNAKREDEEERREIEELLPWHATGTLSPEEAARVEAALAKDPELARQFQMVHDELASTIGLNESLGAPSARALEKLFAKIDAEPPRPFVPAMDWRARLLGFFSALSPRTLALATVAGALVIAAESGLVGVLLSRPAATYETASGPAARRAVGSYVLVQFKSSATMAEITDFLATRGFAITDGPKAGGFYRIRVSTSALAHPALAKVATKLASEPSVAFAVPAN